MKSFIVIMLAAMSFLTARSQSTKGITKATSDRPVGGQCEGCAAVFDYGRKKLTSVDTLPDFDQPGQKLQLSGTIYKHDGKTPAKGVILYIYHTDQTGRYPTNGNDEGWVSKHGHIRGWIKTGADGRYKFYTLKPGPYPEGGNPSHIHPIIKEPGIKEYWIDEYLFEGDPYLTDRIRNSLQGRGGSGILTPITNINGMLIAHRDIVLGTNVPGYE